MVFVLAFQNNAISKITPQLRLQEKKKNIEDQQVFARPVTKYCLCSWVMHGTFLALLLFGKAMLNIDTNA